MAKGSKALDGIFREMLDDMLRVAERKGGKIASGAGERAGREAADGATTAASHHLPFQANWRGADAPHLQAEMRRQLDRQLRTFDGMTPEDILKRLDDVAKRTGKAQKEARERFSAAVMDRQEQLMKRLSVEDPAAFRRMADEFDLKVGDPITRADRLALSQARTDGFMKTVHALHEPDIVAGGLDEIGLNGGLDSFGLGRVNSAIGRQWVDIVEQLKLDLKDMPQDIPIRFTHTV